MKKQSIKTCFLLCLCLFCLFTVGCGNTKNKNTALTKASDFNSPDVTIGVAEGYIFGEVVEKEYPDAKLLYFADREDVYRALEMGDVDGVADDEAIIRAIMRSTDLFTLTEGYVEPSDYAFIFPKNADGEKHRKEFSDYLKKIQENGDLQRIDEKWFGKDTDNKVSEDVSSLAATNGTLSLAFDATTIPFSYFSAGKPVGYDIDLAIGFCREYGYGLMIQRTDFTSLLEGVAAANYDVGCGAITISDHRKETLLFSSPDYTGGISIVKRSEAELEADTDAISSFARHFRKAFIEEDRWQLFLTGILTTFLIFFLAALLGSPFGLILFILSERGGPVLRWLTKAFAFLVHGVPVLMILFSLFYSFYRNMFMGGFIVSIIGFTLYFGDEVYQMIRNQAYAFENKDLTRDYHLLAIDGKTFFRKFRKHSGHILRRDYRERLVTLLKFTSVTGYIAVNDMSRVFETIRTESFEVVLPLLFTTIVYFVIIRLILLLFRDR